MSLRIPSALWIAAPVAAGAAFDVWSPDGRLRVTVALRVGDTVGGPQPVWSMEWDSRPILAESAIGVLATTMGATGGWQVVGHTARATNGTWRPVAGERSVVRDQYRELTIDLRARGADRIGQRLIVRAYDEGAAFRYVVGPAGGGERVRLSAEATEFRFTGDWPAWVTYSGQGDYERAPLSRIRAGCERPLVVEIGSRLEREPGPSVAGDPVIYAAVGEAALVDFARMKFAPLKGAPHALAAQLDGPVEGLAPLESPWRLVMVAESPGRLLENNDIFLNLNAPCAIADVSWIRPGKVIREVTLTTAGGLACVDFALRRGLQFIEYDAGWYGHEYDDAADATTVTVDPKRSKGPLDLPAVLRHAKTNGIGVILYVNRRALERQLDELLPLYRGWGVDGMKFGFVQVGSQRWTAWLHDAVRKAAAHRLMVDVHDEYRETGVRRTWPNLMTVEGVHGDECSPSNRTTLAYAFTRYLSGPADNTVCYYDARVDRLASHAYQLAKPVVLFSPWQFLFWYDRPSQSADEPELEFWNHMPTVWDETRVLYGAIGEYAVVARRSGEDWYLGAMNADTPRRFEVRLDFLPSGRPFTAHVYRDDATVPTRTRVRVERRPVDAGMTLTIELPPRQGQAIRFTPQREAP